MDDPAKPATAFEKHRSTITRLWETEDRKLPYIIQFMEAQHGFSASQRQYKCRLKRWGLWKNIRKHEMPHLARIKVHRDAVCKPTRFKLRGVDVDVTKIDRWIKAQRKKLGDDGFMSSIQNEASTPAEIIYDTEDDGDTVSHSEALDESWEDISTSVTNAFITQDACSHQVPGPLRLNGMVSSGTSDYRDILKDPSFPSDALAQSGSPTSILNCSTATTTIAPVHPTRRLSQYPNAQICFFSTATDDAPSHEREKFSSEKLSMVKEVRRRRPCLPCKTLEIPCTGGDPCDTCLALAQKKLQSSALSWFYCIRTSLKDVNIFQPVYAYHGLPNRMLDLESFEPNLTFEVTWDLENLVETARVWLTKTDDHSKSMIGLLSSKMFSKLAEKHLDKGFVAVSRMLVYATSLAHVRDIQDAEHDGRTTNEMRATAAYSGDKVLDYLDRLLTPESLSQASREALQAYFLVVLGTILATGYSVRLQESPAFICPERHAAFNTMPGTKDPPLLTLWEVMRVHVCEMLSHYLVLISSKLDVHFQQDFQQKLITSAVNQWGKQGYFIWSESTTCWSDRCLCDQTAASLRKLCLRSTPRIRPTCVVPHSSDAAVRRGIQTTNTDRKFARRFAGNTVSIGDADADAEAGAWTYCRWRRRRTRQNLLV